jgi:drug/metabolite transporter (DMT)-like permease
MKFILMISIYVILNSFGQILIKMGTMEIKNPVSMCDVINVKLIFGVFLFGLSFLTWIFILTKFNLSYAFPFAVGFGYAMVIVLSIFILKEVPTFLQIAGMSFVGIGLILMSVKLSH